MKEYSSQIRHRTFFMMLLSYRLYLIVSCSNFIADSLVDASTINYLQFCTSLRAVRSDDSLALSLLSQAIWVKSDP
jgi:hypothetical protein